MADDEIGIVPVEAAIGVLDADETYLSDAPDDLEDAEFAYLSGPASHHSSLDTGFCHGFKRKHDSSSEEGCYDAAAIERERNLVKTRKADNPDDELRPLEKLPAEVRRIIIFGEGIDSHRFSSRSLLCCAPTQIRETFKLYVKGLRRASLATNRRYGVPSFSQSTIILSLRTGPSLQLRIS